MGRMFWIQGDPSQARPHSQLCWETGFVKLGIQRGAKLSPRQNVHVSAHLRCEVSCRTHGETLTFVRTWAFVMTNVITVHLT